jgi:amino acid transporter
MSEIVVLIVEFLLIQYFSSTSAFNAFTRVATIFLSVSYGLLIFVSLVRGRKAVRHSTFSLGKVGFIINAVALAWIFLAIVLFCFPTIKHVTRSTMNYASAVFAGFVLIRIFWYVIRGRKNFTGPPVPSDVEIERDGQVIGQLGRMTTERENTSNRISSRKSK